MPISVLPPEKSVKSVWRDLTIGLLVLVFLLAIVAQVASRVLRLTNNRLSDLSLKLRKQADTDGLTGLHNHRHFQNYLETEIAVAKRYGGEEFVIVLPETNSEGATHWGRRVRGSSMLSKR